MQFKKSDQHKTAYELSGSQVTTPERIVSLFWDLVHARRPRLGSVLDLGAGDCRLAQGGHFKRYVGVEIDKQRTKAASPPNNGRLINGCVFRHRASGYDVCVGNPPYVRHHHIESPWKEDTVAWIEERLGVRLNKHCNLFLYFMCLGLLKTHEEGLLALIIPYEWVSRPSAGAVRDYIRQQNWDVAVYRFKMSIFEDVLTTASINIVDKSSRTGQWRYYDISPDYQVQARLGVADSDAGALEYEKRGRIWALRGLSPGSQRVFTLTEGDRVHSGLTKRDVAPCVTTLKNFPRGIGALTQATFKKHFVDAGERCWLVKSYRTKRSPTLDGYLASVPKAKRDNYTCRNQKPWYNFLPHPIPQLLISSGFTKFGPKVLVNSVGACAVGSVFGIHGEGWLPLRCLQRHLLTIDFEKQVVPHAKTLKKVEVKQFNAVLNDFAAQKGAHGRNSR